MSDMAQPYGTSASGKGSYWVNKKKDIPATCGLCLEITSISIQ